MPFLAHFVYFDLIMLPACYRFTFRGHPAAITCSAVGVGPSSAIAAAAEGLKSKCSVIHWKITTKSTVSSVAMTDSPTTNDSEECAPEAASLVSLFESSCTAGVFLSDSFGCF